MLYQGAVPSEKAHSFFVLKSCEAFASLGISVELVIPGYSKSDINNIYASYGIKNNFKIKKLGSMNFLNFRILSEKILYYLNTLSYSMKCFLYLRRILKKNNIIYSNNLFILFIMSYFNSNLFYEMHDYPENNILFYRHCFKKLRGIITQNTIKIKKIKEDFNISDKKLLYAPNAVDIKKYFINETKEELRKKYNIPIHTKIISYIGKYKTMGMDKGVKDLVAVFSNIINKKDVHLLIVGVNKIEYKEVVSLCRQNNLSADVYTIVKHVSQYDVVRYLKLSDIFIMNYPFNDHFAYYMSPMKMFEYMASKNPIVATDLPSVREVLNRNNSVFVNSDDRASLEEGIIRILNNPDLAKKLLENAYHDVKRYTWEIRAKRIINFIK